MGDFGVTIIDTGYHSTATGATQEAGDFSFTAGTGRANNGVAVTLNVSKIDYKVGAMLGEEVYRNDSDASEINYGGAVSVPGWVVTGALNMTLAADQKVFGNLNAMYKSKGYKNFSSTNDADNYFLMRHYQNNSGAAPVTDIKVRVKNITFSQDGKSGIVRYTITVVETD